MALQNINMRLYTAQKHETLLSHFLISHFHTHPPTHSTFWSIALHVCCVLCIVYSMCCCIYEMKCNLIKLQNSYLMRMRMCDNKKGQTNGKENGSFRLVTNILRNSKQMCTVSLHFIDVCSIQFVVMVVARCRL